MIDAEGVGLKAFRAAATVLQPDMVVMTAVAILPTDVNAVTKVFYTVNFMAFVVFHAISIVVFNLFTLLVKFS
jgi:hypothetical protein